MIHWQMRGTDGTGGEPTSGYMLSSHFLSNPKPQTGNTPRKLLFQEKKKKEQNLSGGEKQLIEMIFEGYDKIALHFLIFTHH